MNIQTFVCIEIVTRAVEIEQLRKLFHLKVARVKKYFRKPLFCVISSSVMSDECLSIPSLEIFSALTPVHWNLKGEILHRLKKAFSSEFGCCRPWKSPDDYSMNMDLSLTFRKETTWSTKTLEEGRPRKFRREGCW